MVRIVRIANDIEKPTWCKTNCSFQMDEVWTFIKNKKQGATYITYCIKQDSGKVLDFVVGQRSYLKISPIIEGLLRIHPKAIYTDRLSIYPKLIPKKKHRVFKYATNKIERKNLNLRTHLKRLSRRTICYSKSEVLLLSHLKIYFWGGYLLE